MSTNTHYMTLGGQDLRVTWHYDPGHPGTMYRSNGDPGDPPEPEEWYAEKVELKAKLDASHDLSPADLWLDITDLATALTRDPGEPGDPIQDALDNLVSDDEPEPLDPEPQEPLPDPVPWWEKV